MNRNKELHDLVKHLERAFPHLILHYEGEYFNSSPPKSGKRSDVENIYELDDFAPPREYDWYEFIQKLEKEGLTITYIK